MDTVFLVLMIASTLLSGYAQGASYRGLSKAYLENIKKRVNNNNAVTILRELLNKYTSSVTSLTGSSQRVANIARKTFSKINSLLDEVSQSELYYQDAINARDKAEDAILSLSQNPFKTKADKHDLDQLEKKRDKANKYIDSSNLVVGHMKKAADDYGKGKISPEDLIKTYEGTGKLEPFSFKVEQYDPLKDVPEPVRDRMEKLDPNRIYNA